MYLSCIFTLFKYNIPLDVLPVIMHGKVANFFKPHRLLDVGSNCDKSTYFYIMRFLYENTMLIRSKGLHAILPSIFLSVPFFFFRIVLERVETKLEKPEVLLVDAWSCQGSCKHILFLFYFCLNSSLYEKWLFWREGADPSAKNDIPLQLFHSFAKPFNPHGGNMLEKYPAIDLFWWLTPPVHRKYINGASVVYIHIGPNLGGRGFVLLSPLFKTWGVQVGQILSQGY